MNQKMVLIAEDEPKIAKLLEEYLREHGEFQTATLYRGDEVPRWIVRHAPDLVLLDVMLPGLDGLEICKQVRKESTVPIIMITARTEEIDRLLGLELGADDYICKPFSPREVVARVRAVLRRAASVTGASVGAAGLTIDRERHRASLNGKSLALTPVELALLSALIAQPGRVFTRDQLMNVMYADYRVVNDRAVDAHIRNLRRKLQELDSTREFIESVYGVGYLACQRPN